MAEKQGAIETERPQAVQLDGNEAEPTTRLEIRIEPGALQLVRAPTTDAAGRPLPEAPQTPLGRGARAAAWPLLLGAGTAAWLQLRALTAGARGGRPHLGVRHALLAGLVVTAVARLFRRKGA